MTTYQSVRAQIAKLEKQAESLKRQELKNVIAQVREMVAQYELTAADLGLGGGRGARGAKARGVKKTRRASAGVGVAKYRDPATGQTWTGHGRPPAWIVSAKNRDAFLIDGAAPAKKKPAAKKAGAKKAVAKKAAKKGRARKTPAVQIESGVAAQ
ncbi:H-NS family nucleoid-associated regulatory protein [Piscinibacter sp.]|uniref:H-NS histone family protein n=1 Tax=Piscinibacter sp. TaxID=1903157 RepID=UPI0039E3EB8F